MSQTEALREEISWMRTASANKDAEIARLRADLKSTEIALWQFADDRNWNDEVACLQWVGKRHAIEYARSIVEGLSSPFFIGMPVSPAPTPEPAREGRMEESK